MNVLSREPLDLKSICNRYWLLIVSALGTIACACLIVVTGWSLLWPQTEATITDYTFSKKPYFRPCADLKVLLSAAKSPKFAVTNLVYTYQASNQTFRSNPIAFRQDVLGDPVAYAERHPKGSRVKLWVNPFDPSRSTLAPGENFANSILFFVVCVLLTFCYAIAEFPRRK